MSREVKDSGIEWIGDIPKDWNIIKIKRNFNVINGSTPKSDNAQFWGGNIVWITPAEMAENIVEIYNSRRTITADGLHSCGTILVPPKSIIVSNRAPIGQVCMAGIDLCTNQGCKSLVSKIDNIEKYFYYFLICQTDTLKMLGRGTTFLELSTYDLANYKIPIPYSQEQKKIVDFLDNKTSQIDSTIALQKEAIRKYKEYKQSLITETVTKGLDKNVKMKDSGIEWIGEIPEDWEITRIGTAYGSQLGKMLQPQKNRENDSMENYICAANMSWGKIRIEPLKGMWFSEKEKTNYKLNQGDLIITEGGDIGVSCIWNNEVENCYFQNALHRVNAKTDSINKYLYYWLTVLKSVGYLDLICNKATIAHFTKDKLLNSIFILSDASSQQKIIEFLDKKCPVIDAAIIEKVNLIIKLEEYKKSLIYEYVTGKKEVC